jgi:hypothetical protein
MSREISVVGAAPSGLPTVGSIPAFAETEMYSRPVFAMSCSSLLGLPELLELLEFSEDSALGDPPSSEQEVKDALSVRTPRTRNPFLKLLMSNFKRFMFLQILD